MRSAGAASSVTDLAEGEDWSRQSKLGAHPDGLTEVAAGSSESHFRVMSQDIHTGHAHGLVHALSQNDNVERRLEAQRRAPPALPSCSCCSATAAAGNARTENFFVGFSSSASEATLGQAMARGILPGATVRNKLPVSSDGSAAPWRLTSVTTERLDGKFAFGLLTGLLPLAFGCPFHSPNPECRPSLRWACLKGVAPDPPSEWPTGTLLLLTGGPLFFFPCFVGFA